MKASSGRTIRSSWDCGSSARRAVARAIFFGIAPRDGLVWTTARRIEGRRKVQKNRDNVAVGVKEREGGKEQLRTEGWLDWRNDEISVK